MAAAADEKLSLEHSAASFLPTHSHEEHNDHATIPLPDTLLDDEAVTPLDDDGAAAASMYEDEATLKRSHEDVYGNDDECDEEEQKRQKLKMGVAKKVNNEQWDAMFERLVAYKAQHGDCLVPKRYATDPKLGTWVETQRVQYKRLDRAADESGVPAVQPNKRLTQERLHKLESIGFCWSAKGRKKEAVLAAAPSAVPPKRKEESRAARGNRLNDSQWEEMYLRLVDFKELHGSCLVPRKYQADPKLATWVETQRVLWNRDTTSVHPQQHAAAAASSTTTLTKAEEAAWAAEIKDALVEDAAAELAASMEDLAHPPEEGSTEAAAAAAEYDEDKQQQQQQLLYQPKRLTQERKDKLDAIGFVWSLRNKRIDDHWDEMFRQLVEYKESHGDCLVPSRFEENLKLGKWVETQRYEYTKLQRFASEEVKADSDSGKPRPTNPRLTEERLRRLEDIGFEWKVKHKMKRYYDKQWDQMFDRLLKFREANGHCMVPKRFPPDMKLGTWVHTQRIQYRKMVAGTKPWDPAETDSGQDNFDIKNEEEEVTYRLTDDRRKRLEEIGFVWSARESEKVESGRITRNSYDDQWDAMFNRLKAYKETHGDCLVPKRCKEDAKLGTWVDTQRVQYKKMKKKLASQGVDYDGPSSANEENEESDSASPKPVVGRLTDDRIRRLEALGFVWSLRDDWQKHYDELKEYKKEHGHCNVPARYTKNRRLGIWVSAQRQQYKIMQGPEDSRQRRSAPLTQERIDKLNEIGFTWTIRSRDSLGESWNQRLQDLREYKAQYGNCLVPSRYPPNPELGVWVGTQRTQYRLYTKANEEGRPVSGASAMNEERIQQLEDIGFVWALRGGEGKKEPLDAMDETAAAMEEEALQVAGEVALAAEGEVFHEGISGMAPGTIVQTEII